MNVAASTPGNEDDGEGQRVAFDFDRYEKRMRLAPCFICAVAAGGAMVPAEIVWQNDRYVAFLAEFPDDERRGIVLRGHVLLAPGRPP